MVSNVDCCWEVLFEQLRWKFCISESVSHRVLLYPHRNLVNISILFRTAKDKEILHESQSRLVEDCTGQKATLELINVDVIKLVLVLRLLISLFEVVINGVVSTSLYVYVGFYVPLFVGALFLDGFKEATEYGNSHSLSKKRTPFFAPVRDTRWLTWLGWPVLSLSSHYPHWL